MKRSQVDLGHKKLTGTMRRAFLRASATTEKEFRAELTSSKWAWPRLTRRSRGQLVFSPRDINDTGALLRSYRQRKVRGGVEHAWDVPYANVVHDGARLKSGTLVPPRPWTKEPLKRLPTHMAQEMERLT